MASGQNKHFLHSLCVWKREYVCVLVCLFSRLDVWFVAPGWLWTKEDCNLLYIEITQALALMEMEESEFPSQKTKRNNWNLLKGNWK